MKSLLTGVLFPAWEWGPARMPEKRFLSTAHKQDLAVRDNLKCRRLIQSDWYQTRWPLAIVGDQNAKTKFENDKTGFREAMAFTSMTGARGDRVILDDPLSADDANSDAAMLAAERTFLEALPTRVNNEASAIVVIMQRLHQRDTSGIILGRGLPYTHLCLPMRFEPERRCSTSIGFTDPRTEPGELLFPERFPESQVADLERTLGSYATAGQLQQRPAPRGGGIFRDEWWGYYTPGAEPEIVWRGIWADTAQKTAESSDYSVFQCWGATADRKAVLLDQIRGRWEAPELLTHARAFWAKHRAVQGRGTLRAMYIEDKVSGTGLIQTLRREGVPVLGIQRNKDKRVRAMDAAPRVESGNVLLPRGADWLSDWLGEVGAFPHGAHDDQVDPMADAVVAISGVMATTASTSTVMGLY
ncbi:phage terminase large subunit [Segnochrobactraceae bacterium EtOH-i3]